MGAKISILLVFTSLCLFVNAQNDGVTKDSLKLPFAISNEKMLSEEDLANKKEGTYATGVPDLSSDPVNGFGYGFEGTIYFNGKKSDPFFKYTAYRAALNITLFNTTRNQREIKIGWDIPYIFDTKWRLRGEIAYEINPNLLYFGIDGKTTLPGLSYAQSNGSIVSNARYSDYANSLTGANTFYNTYQKREAILNVSMERSYLEGKFRLLVGYELAGLNLTSLGGPTANSLMQKDYSLGKIIGVGKNVVSFVQLGAIYDSRDLETDPSAGVFAELTNEASLIALGSQYNFNKTFAHVNYYKKILPSVFKKLVFAGRIAAGYTAGNAPFYEYQDEWSSEGSIEGLGGGTTLRGYKQSRFLDRIMQFNNFELRYRFSQFNLFKQHIALSAVPFFDAGAVWNTGGEIFQQLKNFRFNEGLGLRIAWNVNTIVRFDYAISKEDGQFFFSLGHAF